MKEIHMSAAGTANKTKRIGKKVGNVVTGMLGISIILVVTLCVGMFYSLAIGMLEQQCVNGTNILEYELNNYKGDDKTDLLDELKSRMGCEFTIFEDDKRAYTTVVQDGKRVVGTKLSDELSDIVLKQGKSYVGKAEILGQEHICSYVPTKNAKGQVDGLVFAGISSADAREQILLTIILSIVAGVIAITICILFLMVYLKKSVTYPLKELTRVVQDMERGDLGLVSGDDIKVNIQSDDEIGMLGKILRDTMIRLRGYIGEISKILEAIANGDLTSQIRQEYIGDFISIKNSMDVIENRLNNTMGQIVQSTAQVSGGANQMSDSAQMLAQGATEQTGSVQDLVVTINQISDSSKKTAVAAEEAGQFVTKAGEQLSISVGYVEELNTTMENIYESSEEIRKIIDTIENIAFQTNILALNAAVEATRAGSAGKGFNVVADEVRNLANKCDEAAKATKDLINGSITVVNQGREAVERVTTSLEATNKMSGSMTDKMSIVVEAVESQAASIVKVTEGIDQISAVVQINSATSEECAATSEELSSQVSLLKNLIGTFRLKSETYQ
ncbi:MAG: HAMP domain-containing protein [Firmicutes bacterium]|nr:HAMP domain-containing protein [Bacillota bacterium]